MSEETRGGRALGNLVEALDRAAFLADDGHGAALRRAARICREDGSPGAVWIGVRTAERALRRARGEDALEATLAAMRAGALAATIAGS